MNHSCSSVSGLLERYFDRELTAAENVVVERHLKDCRACQDELRAMQGLRALVKAPVDDAVRAEDFPWLWQKIERGIVSKEEPTWWGSLQSRLGLSQLLRKRVWVPALAAAVVVILLLAPQLYKKTSSLPGSFVVDYVESETNNVMVYQLEQSKVTVIWLFEGNDDGAPTS